MIAWDDTILVGIRSVDEDHKNILNHINQFIGHVEAKSGIAEIHDSFRRMERCIYRHLEVEEQMLAALGYEQTRQHMLAHRKLTEELDEIWDDMLADPKFRPDDAARRWLETWLFKHVKTEDFLYRDWITVRTGAHALRNSLFAILENRKAEISPRMSDLIVGLYDDWLGLDERIEIITGEIEMISKSEENCQRLMSVPGIGPIISTAMVAAIGTGDAFGRGRDFGAWLGLVPRQYSTGGKTVLGRISKRGSKYLRTLFIQAAHVILMRPHNWQKFSFGPWLTEAATRLHRNKLATALANKLARIAWSVLANQKSFDTNKDEVTAI